MDTKNIVNEATKDLNTNQTTKTSVVNNPIVKKIKSIKINPSGVVLSLLVVGQIATLFFLLNPINLYNQYSIVQRVNKAIAGVKVAPASTPTAVGIIGDNVTLKPLDEIKKNNIDAEVYKDAKDGDMVIGYNSRVVIFRESENKVVYDGESSSQKLTNAQNTLNQAIIKATKDAGLIKADPTVNPAVAIVENAIEFRKANEIFNMAENGDVMATFNENNLVVLYRPTLGKIVGSGTIKTSITR
jgi:hypothetical protein